MEKYYVCLLDCECNDVSYHRGDIVIREPGVGPPGVPWASFDPPADLKGTPALIHITDNGSGDLVFTYSIEEVEAGFVVRARIGLPQAVVVIEAPGRSAARDHAPPEAKGKPVLPFHAGIAATKSRGNVRWAPGGCKPTSKPKEPWDPLRYDASEKDILRRGM